MSALRPPSLNAQNSPSTLGSNARNSSPSSCASPSEIDRWHRAGYTFAEHNKWAYYFENTGSALDARKIASSHGEKKNAQKQLPTSTLISVCEAFAEEPITPSMETGTAESAPGGSIVIISLALLTDVNYLNIQSLLRSTSFLFPINQIYARF